MSAFHVYVEAPVDRSPEGIQRLAAAISKKYGLPVPDLVKRMTAGRFRVKANVDAATADTYARALAECGASVTVEDAAPTPPAVPKLASEPPPATPSRPGAYSSPPKPPTTPSVGPSSAAPSSAPMAPPTQPAPTNAARPGGASLPPSSVPRPAVSSLPPRTAPSSLPPANERSGSTSLPPANAPRAASSGYQSGLSAAYTPESSVESDLGAIGGDTWSLSSLDGNDAVGMEGSFDMASPAMPASIGPAPEDESAPAVTFATPKPAAPKDVPLDLFAPPDAAEAEQVVNLVEEAPAPRQTPMPSTQTPPHGVQASPALTRRTPVSQAVVTGVSVPDMPRSRIVAGVVLAILLGFIPAHLIAATRESSAFKEIDARIVAAQNAADTPELYETLDSFRAAQLDNKESKRRSLALQSLLIWGVVAAGLGYVWFRKIPWDRASRA
ncbi:MAG: hypothetical protein H0T42_16925 [Deltaproteobacteria bacterium]|nr:hypothetical protein [Deltaproteobacteria bacterium]